MGKFDFFMRKKANSPFGDGRRVAKKRIFSKIPLVWIGFRLISMAKRMAKKDFCIKYAYFPTNRK